ncbi:hypothetical protein BMETH_509_1 [methanotrophic bacterial endosymbiont of Bathymodiolus sp.]|nr:hypothetical protein BMETH_509_1 [methanotrophic bacterial endosymbiont of Bathymodiolus sp.]
MAGSGGSGLIYTEPLIVTVIRFISCCLSAVMKTLQRPFLSKQLTIMAFLIRSLWIKVVQTMLA